jgi:hypothetical protein
VPAADVGFDEDGRRILTAPLQRLRPIALSSLSDRSKEFRQQAPNMLRACRTRISFLDRSQKRSAALPHHSALNSSDARANITQSLNVRFAAHTDLIEDIAPCPKSAKIEVAIGVAGTRCRGCAVCQ